MAKLISSLPIGAKVRFGKHQVNTEAKQDIIWKVAAKNHAGYPANSVTLVAENIMDLRGFDAKEPSNSNADRKSYGNNRYKDSNLRQWLNKAGKPWFVKTHTADEPPTDGGMNQPTGYDNRDGFLSAFTTDELGAILNTSLKVVKNTVTDGGGSETVEDKVFLLSTTEVGLADENSIAEGSRLPLFTTDNSSRISEVTQQCFSNTKSSSKPSNVSSAWYWWLRTPDSGNSSNVRDVYSGGSLGNNTAYTGNHGVRPALNLNSGIMATDSPDSNGVYTLIYNAPPTISGSDENLGNISDEITKSYTVFDSDGDKLSIVERLNNKVLNYYNDVDSGTTKELNIPKEKIYSLPIGETNTISIEVSDGTETVFRKWTFIRTNTAPIIQVISESELGEIIDPFESKIKINDPEEDSVNVEYIVNRIQLNTNDELERIPVYTKLEEEVVLDSELTFTIPKVDWEKLLIGDYELHVIAKDDQGGESKEVISFIRTEDEIEFTTEAIIKDIQPQQIVTLFEIKGNPTNVLIEACNNALDESPTWEDITTEARSSIPYTFTNATKTADNWAVATRIKLDGKVI